MEALCQAAWPGNVRQLENVVERLLVTARRDRIELEDLPAEVPDEPSGVDSLLEHGTFLAGIDDEEITQFMDTGSEKYGFDPQSVGTTTRHDFSSLRLVVRTPGRMAERCGQPSQR